MGVALGAVVTPARDVLAPAAMPPPAAAYAHAVVVTGASRWLYTAGVVPVAADGSVPEGVAAQALLVWHSIATLLEEAAMAVSNVVSVTTYVALAAANELAAVMTARDEALGGHLAASTLVTVPALAQPAWLLEIAVVAAA